jgi:predicted HTH transcriptional regulator
MSRTLDLRDVVRDERGIVAAVDSGDTGTSQNQNSAGTSQNVELAEMRPRQKIWYFAAQQMRAVTRSEIAKGLGYKKAPWINAHIESLVSEGWLAKTELPSAGTLPTYVYTATRPKKQPR